MNNEYITAMEKYENEDFEEAYNIFYTLAQNDMYEAQVKLAYMLYEGVGTTKDIEKSLFWFEKMVDDNIEAYRMMGWCYLQIDNIVEGKNSFNKAIEMGNLDAIIDMGSFYDFGDYTFPIDKEKALEYYTRGCTLGSKAGCKSMGLLLQELDRKLVPYIKEHIGLIKFLKTMLSGNVFYVLGSMLSGKCFFKKK